MESSEFRFTNKSRGAGESENHRVFKLGEGPETTESWYLHFANESAEAWMGTVPTSKPHSRFPEQEQQAYRQLTEASKQHVVIWQVLTEHL